MVRIRYSELPVGLHVTAVAVGRQTIVYLLPGLTASERKSALLRVRSSARVGHGPSLPRIALAEALAADRLRAGLHTVSAAVRRHPLLMAPFVALIVSLTVLAITSGSGGATLGHLAGPLSRSAPTSRQAVRLAVHPDPMAWRRHLQSAQRDRHYDAWRHGGAAGRRGGYLWLSRNDSTPVSRRPTVAGTSRQAAGHCSSGRHCSLHRRSLHHSSLHHGADRRWRLPAPCHVGT